jgi:flagellar hook-basal body complex protein FliE
MEVTRVHSLLEQLQKSEEKNRSSSQLDAFTELLKEASAESRMAAESAEKFLTTGEGELHQVQLQMAKADLTFRFLVEVRNKLADAYQEISRLPV